MSRNSTYQIIAKFEGTTSIVAGYRQIQAEARRTSRAIIDGARAEQRALTEARRREAQVTREASRAQRDAQRTQQRVWLEAHRLRAEDLANHRSYISGLKRQESQMREDRRKALGQAGIGLAGLALVGVGVKKAGSFEDALHGLRTAFQEAGAGGAVDIAKLNAQMERAGEIGIDLGNKLQGTTQDYLEIFSALKKSGVDVETILTGAGRAAGYLANVSGTVRTGAFREQAEELGQFGLMFNLRPQEFEAQVNIFAALKDRFNVESSSLIESAKYFQATAASLNLTGLAGATDTTKVFALLKRRGAIEGGQAGTGLTSLFSHYITHKKEVDKLRKETGIDLKFFDEKGQFRGFESLFAQMAQFRKLSSEQRSASLFKIFGEQGAKAANVMVEAGAEGWANIGTEMKKAVPVSEKINQQMELFNSKLEAVVGSAENLVVKAFTPMLESLKPVLDVANEGLGKLTDFAGEHPRMAKFATSVAGIGSAYLLVRGGIRAASLSLGLWRVATRLAAAENLLLATSAQTAGRQIGFASAASGLGGAARGGMLARLGLTLSRAVPIAAAVAVLGATIQSALANSENEEKAAQAGERIGQMLRERFAAEVKGMSADVRHEMDKVMAPELAKELVTQQGLAGADITMFEFWRGGKSSMVDLLESMKMERTMGLPLDPFSQRMRNRERSRISMSLASPEHLQEYLRQSLETLKKAGREDLFPELKKLAESAVPQLVAELDKQAKTNQELASSADRANRSVRDLIESLNHVQRPLFSPPGEFNLSPPGFKLPGMAAGGIARRPMITALAERGPEAVIPLDRAGMFGGLQVTYAPTINAPGATPQTVEQIKAVLARHKGELWRMVRDEMNNEFRDRQLAI